MLILVRVLFVVTVVGTIDVLTVASSVDAMDGRLLGILLYAALPGTAGFVLSLYARTGGVWPVVRRCLPAASSRRPLRLLVHRGLLMAGQCHRRQP
ncbi:hypothetical protein [Streptomyces sp. 061-3]|uniref:hypothetical protein n=1 Tax=Streptomyces sp. 061-3 TaxID=2789268 RepID=UPI00398145A6